MTSLPLFLVFLTSTILCSVPLTEEQRKIAHEFAKIFLEDNLPMYIREKLREKLINSIFDPPLIYKFKFKDCEGKEYGAESFVDNFLLAGKLGGNLRVDEKGEDGIYKRPGLETTIYLTHFHTDLDTYSISLTFSNSNPDLQFYSIIAKCYTKYCN
ncbi:unnamed protein product [Caenorhabditis angaria]|uniref:Uncharacterized protein n=1 Tax=Caenorhabditis angaria TaxID=860376 RepID=A0A9P1MWQ1_9PELO|nr:unnamed protein product [Caenorhabditis angaria]